MLPLNIAVSDLMVGNNSLQIVLSDAEGNRATVTATINTEAPPGNNYVKYLRSTS